MLEAFKSFINGDNDLIQYTGFIGRTKKDWTQRRYVALITGKEKKLLVERFNPQTDGCIMDTIAREMPERIYPI